jgi:hypothetical protein
MHILVLVHGHYGQRIVRHVQAHRPPEWRVESLTLPRVLPAVIDEPEKLLPPHLGPADLILHLGETPQAAQLLPTVVTRSQAKAVIAPVDNGVWLPEGLKNQLGGDLAALGVPVVFPSPLCSLTEEHAGFGCQAEPYHSPLVACFARHFGRPRFTLKIDADGRVIEEAVVERGAPCGSTHFAAARLMGMPVTGMVPRAGLIALHYPCLASMHQKCIDNQVETLMHTSGRIVNEELELAIGHLSEPGCR